MENSLNPSKIKTILYHAYRCLLFDEMVINQSKTWLSEEKGNENMMREIMARRRKEEKLEVRS